VICTYVDFDENKHPLRLFHILFGAVLRNRFHLRFALKFYLQILDLVPSQNACTIAQLKQWQTYKTDSSCQISRRKQNIKLSHERKSSWVITVDYLLFVLNVRFIRVVSCSNATWVKTIRQHKRVNRNQIQLTQRRIKHNNGLHLNRVLDHTNT
jgi:hypothetical protein